MRVLQVAPFYEPAWAYGGMARAASGLCRALAARGHQVTVLTALTDGNHARQESAGGVRIHRFRGPVALLRRLVPWPCGLRRTLSSRAAGFDIAHLHGHRNGLAVAAIPTLSAAGVPWVLQPHGTYPHHGQHRWAKAAFDHLMGRRVVAGARAWLAVSRAEAGDLPRPAVVAGNGVEDWSGTRPVAAGGRRLLFVGSDARQKRGHVLPEVMRALPGTELHLVGRFAPAFRARFEGLGKRVRISDPMDGRDLALAYAEADLVVHPAAGEAFGLVPFEAALAGTASVVAGGHGCGEWYGAAGGCVVPPDDTPALVEALRDRLGQPARARQEAQAVAAFARRELSWARVAEKVERVYLEVLQSPGAGRP